VAKNVFLIVKRFPHIGIPILCFYLFFDEKINDPIGIELKVIEFEIESNIITKNEAYKALLGDIIFKPTKYGFNDSKEAILKNIKVQVKEIITLLSESQSLNIY
jgi:hypothetical protein